MPQTLDVFINKPDEFDQAVHGDDKLRALPSGDDIQIITKDGGMVAGADGKARAVCVITWQVMGPDGKVYRAQFSTSVRLLKSALRLIEAGYDDDGMPKPGTFGR